MKLPAAILLALVATPALAGAGGWGTAAPQQAAIKPPPAPAPQPAASWCPVDPPQKTTPNGIDHLLPGMKLNPKTGYVDFNTVLTTPPAAYDHPYKGDLTIVETSMEHVKELCPPMQGGFPPIGCAFHPRAVPRAYCKIVVAHADEIKAVGFDPDTTFRHEQAHCNGWPADHPGVR